jgi:hypothetical protein
LHSHINRQGVLLGGTTASSPEEYFGFHHKEVRAIHFHKQGTGEGLWFRLRDGRVIDEVARASIRDPGLHYQVAG